VVLLQLPPHARVGVEKLVKFLDLVPDNVPVAFEFRHPSWRDEAVFAALARHNAAWVTADNEGGEAPALPKTSTLTYLRLRAETYSDETLRSWKAHCADFERAFVYFKHEEGGAGPAYAERMLALYAAFAPGSEWKNAGTYGPSTRRPRVCLIPKSYIDRRPR